MYIIYRKSSRIYPTRNFINFLAGIMHRVSTLIHRQARRLSYDFYNYIVWRMQYTSAIYILQLFPSLFLPQLYAKRYPLYAIKAYGNTPLLTTIHYSLTTNLE